MSCSPNEVGVVDAGEDDEDVSENQLDLFLFPELCDEAIDDDDDDDDGGLLEDASLFRCCSRI